MTHRLIFPSLHSSKHERYTKDIRKITIPSNIFQKKSTPSHNKPHPNIVIMKKSTTKLLILNFQFSTLNSQFYRQRLKDLRFSIHNYFLHPAHCISSPWRRFSIKRWSLSLNAGSSMFSNTSAENACKSNRRASLSPIPRCCM